MSSAGPSARLVSTRALGTDERRTWQRLADRAAEPNPFFRPDFVLAAVEGRREHADLLVVEDGDGWLACLPVRAARMWRRFPLPCLAPWLPQYSYLATPLVDRDRVDEAADGLADLVAARRRAAALVLDPLDGTGPVGMALSRAFAARGLATIAYRQRERAALRRRPERTYLREALSSRRRKEMRRLMRALRREAAGEVEQVDRSADADAPETFLALERKGWKGERGTAIASRDDDADFFRRMCRAFSARGELQLLALVAGGHTVAMQCNLLDGEVGFGFKVAYDPEWARFSPGALLEVEALTTFHDHPSLTSFDSCAATGGGLIDRLWPDRRSIQTLLVPTRAPLGRLVSPMVRFERRLAARRGKAQAAMPAAADES